MQPSCSMKCSVKTRVAAVDLVVASTGSRCALLSGFCDQLRMACMQDDEAFSAASQCGITYLSDAPAVAY
jgi:hypothetical protein